MLRVLKNFDPADLIGVVENPGQLYPIITKSGERIVHSFTLTDGIDSCKINVWEEHQHASNVLFTPNLDTPVVVIVASAKIQYFSGT